MAGTLSVPNLWPLIQPPALAGLVAALGTKFTQPFEDPSPSSGVSKLLQTKASHQSCSTSVSLYAVFNCNAPDEVEETASEVPKREAEEEVQSPNTPPKQLREESEAPLQKKVEEKEDHAGPPVRGQSKQLPQEPEVLQPPAAQQESPPTVEQQKLEEHAMPEARVVEQVEKKETEESPQAEEDEEKDVDEDLDLKIKNVQAAWQTLHKETEIQVMVWRDCARARHAGFGQRFSAAQSALQEALVGVLDQAGSVNVEDKVAVLHIAQLLIKVLEQDADEGGILTNATRMAAAAAVQAVAVLSGPAAAKALQLPTLPVPAAPEQKLRNAADVSRSSVSAASKTSGRRVCDKCDGPHATDACPHFRKPREKHKDAWVNYGREGPKQMGSSGGNFVLRSARVVPQPGDGSCLFHSLCHGLNGGRSGGSIYARELRQELMRFIERNPQLEIAGDTLEEWVRWDANSSVSAYCRRMSFSGWGGGIEMAACSVLKKVNVHVYERRWLSGFKRISCFDYPEPTNRTIHVLYQGQMHYDALVPY